LPKRVSPTEIRDDRGRKRRSRVGRGAAAARGRSQSGRQRKPRARQTDVEAGGEGEGGTSQAKVHFGLEGHVGRRRGRRRCAEFSSPPALLADDAPPRLNGMRDEKVSILEMIIGF
jgi:hypothetical protein